MRETYIKISSYFLEKGLVSMEHNTSHIMLRAMWDKFLPSFFDGVASDGLCGCGMVTYQDPDELYCFKWCSGQGTNTREELLALWGILLCANWMGIEDIDIFGDSKVIIDWENKRATLNSFELLHCMNKTKSFLPTFRRISISHVYREQNMVADRVSKEGRNTSMDHIHYWWFAFGTPIWEGCIDI